MIARLTSSSLAGTSRKLVAVGTSRLASMLATMRAPTPRMGASAGAAAAAGGGVRQPVAGAVARGGVAAARAPDAVGGAVGAAPSAVGRGAVTIADLSVR